MKKKLKLLLISDTHWRIPEQISPELREHIDWCDQILHAGDWTMPEIHKELTRLKPVVSALGNCDRAPLHQMHPKVALETFKGVKIAVTHGFGAPDGIIELR